MPNTKSVFIFIFLLMPLSILLCREFASAQTSTASSNPNDTKKPFSFQYCELERELYCSDKKDLSEIGPCLIAHKDDLLVKCRQDLERYMLFRNQASSRGGGALSAFGGLNAMGPPVPLISYDFRYSPGINSATLTENKFNISAPVFHSDKHETISASFAGGEMNIGTPVTLSSGYQVPANFYRVELGGVYFHPLMDNKNWGMRASVGYAGDAPFQNAGDTTYSLSGSYGFPGTGNGYWMVFVFLSNNSPLGNNIPIPGFDYLYRSENFTGIFGFPITAIEWTPVFPWTYSFGFFGPTTLAEVDYGSIDKIQYFSGFYWTRQTYIPSQRAEDLDRLTIQEMKIAVGMRTPLWHSLSSEIQIGRVFNRSIYISDNPFSQDGGSASLSDDWYVSLSLKHKF